MFQAFLICKRLLQLCASVTINHSKTALRSQHSRAFFRNCGIDSESHAEGWTLVTPVPQQTPSQGTSVEHRAPCEFSRVYHLRSLDISQCLSGILQTVVAQFNYPYYRAHL